MAATRRDGKDDATRRPKQKDAAEPVTSPDSVGAKDSDNPLVEADRNPVESDAPYPGGAVDAAAARGEKVTTVKTENVDDGETRDHNDAGPAVQGDAPLVEDTSRGIPDAVQAVSEGDEGVHAGEVSAGATPQEGDPVHDENAKEDFDARLNAWNEAVTAVEPPPDPKKPVRLTSDVLELYINQYILTSAEAEQVALAQHKPHSKAEKDLVQKLKNERTGGLSHPLTQYEARLRARDKNTEA